MVPSLRPPSSRTEPEASHGKAEAILLVDADDSYVLAQTRSLRRLGYPYVFRARSVPEALDMLKHLCPTIVLTDGVCEGPAAWSELLKCSAELGASTVIVSSERWPDSTAPGVRMFMKADLKGEMLERLIRDLVAENRTSRRESARCLRASAGRAVLATTPDHLKTA